jgi:hypothetical protein
MCDQVEINQFLREHVYPSLKKYRNRYKHTRSARRLALTAYCVRETDAWKKLRPKLKDPFASVFNGEAFYLTYVESRLSQVKEFIAVKSDRLSRRNAYIRELFRLPSAPSTF